jgi:hypothetical protein
MFDDAIHFLVEAQEAPDWDRLGQNLPYEWIEQAVAYPSIPFDPVRITLARHHAGARQATSALAKTSTTIGCSAQ